MYIFLNQFKWPVRWFSGFHNWFIVCFGREPHFRLHINNIRLLLANEKRKFQSIIYANNPQPRTLPLECDCPSTWSRIEMKLGQHPHKEPIEPHSNSRPEPVYGPGNYFCLNCM